MRKSWIYWMAGVLMLFGILHFLNLDRIPLVWFDEVMGLDPAVNAIFKDGYHSMIWPQAGTEDRFMAYLPVRFLFHMLHLQVLPFEPYWQRLPWALYFFASAYFLYRSIRTKDGSILLALLVGYLFVMDRAVFEVARSMRVDPLSLMFLAATGWAYFQKNTRLLAVLSSLLVFIHPNLWFAALALFLSAGSKAGTWWKPKVTWSIPIVFALAYLYSIQWDVQGLYAQLFEHGSDHSASGGVMHRLSDHLITRFWPYYTTQPYIPLLIYAALILAVRNVLKKKGSAMNWALILTHLYWISILAPLPRYNAVLLLLSILSLVEQLPAWESRIKPYWVIPLLLIHPVNAFARQGLALAQSAERDPEPVIDWIENALPVGSCLITGSDVAYYAVGTDAGHDYCMYNLQPLKHQPEAYDHCMLLLHLPADSMGLGITNKAVTTYQVIPNKRFEQWTRRLDSPTYEHLGLFEVSASEFRRITAVMDERNRKD